MKKATTIGGQALIEGIMMKGPDKTALAVRLPDHTIDIDYMQEKHLRDRVSFFGWPVIRGVVNFVESMIQGYRALMVSADKSGLTDLEETGDSAEKGSVPAADGTASLETEENPSDAAAKITEKEAEAKPADKAEGKPFAGEKKTASEILVTVVMVIGSVLGVALAVFLFLYVPALLFDLLNRLIGGVIPQAIRPLFEGILKIMIFVGYIAAISCMKDIRRVFMYHGAEHKTIFCYESGEELSVENVRKQSRFHPRCGTSFMILMLIVGILFSLLTVTLFPAITGYRVLWVAVKILLIPLICGLGYELIKICGRHDNLVTRMIAAPGMWVQRLTTKEPEDDMIEVAIASLQAVIPDDPDKDRW